jgi:hypothetical protein
MKRAWLVNLLLLVGVAGLAWYALYRPKQDEEPKYKISSLSAASVQRIRIEPREGQPVTLEKRGGSWFLTAPLEARADRTQVERLLDLVTATSREKLAATDLARFELDQPRLKIIFDGQTLAFGVINTLSQDQYVLSGDSVYMVSSYFASVVPTRPDRLLTHALFREGEKQVGFRLKDFALVQKDGKWTLSPEPAEDKDKPSADDLNRWVDEWRFASSLITQPASARKPIEQIQVQLADGKTLSLGVLQKQPELILVRPDEKLQYQFSAENGRRLLARPAPSPSPAPDSTSGVKAP